MAENEFKTMVYHSSFSIPDARLNEIFEPREVQKYYQIIHQLTCSRNHGRRIHWKPRQRTWCSGMHPHPKGPKLCLVRPFFLQIMFGSVYGGNSRTTFEIKMFDLRRGDNALQEGHHQHSSWRAGSKEVFGSDYVRRMWQNGLHSGNDCACEDGSFDEESSYRLIARSSDREGNYRVVVVRRRPGWEKCMPRPPRRASKVLLQNVWVPHLQRLRCTGSPQTWACLYNYAESLRRNPTRIERFDADCWSERRHYRQRDPWRCG